MNMFIDSDVDEISCQTYDYAFNSLPRAAPFMFIFVCCVYVAIGFDLDLY